MGLGGVRDCDRSGGICDSLSDLGNNFQKSDGEAKERKHQLSRDDCCENHKLSGGNQFSGNRIIKVDLKGLSKMTKIIHLLTCTVKIHI